MASPVTKKKKFSSIEIDEHEQQSMGSIMTSLGKQRNVSMAKKMDNRILRKIPLNYFFPDFSWICTDVWMDILPFFDRPQLCLKMAILSPRFDVLVDAHFDGKSKLTIWKQISILKDTDAEMPKLSVSIGHHTNSIEFPWPDRPLSDKIRFSLLHILYIDYFVLAFLGANQQIFDKSGTKLSLLVSISPDIAVQPIWAVFVREIWPIFAANVRQLDFSDGEHLENLRRHTSPTILTDLNQLTLIVSGDLFPEGIDDPSAIASAGQALFEWLDTPRKDGQPKRLFYTNYGPGNIYEWVVSFKEPFLRATTSVCYKIQFELFNSVEFEPFELVNERTKEVLILEKEADTNDDWLLKRCQIGETAKIQWEYENGHDLNDVNFWLFKGTNCIGPLSPPKASQQQNAKSDLKMILRPSERKSE